MTNHTIMTRPLFIIVATAATLFIIVVLALALAMARWDGNTRSDIPNIIWTYWDSVKDMPPVVHTCIRSWRAMNPTYDVRLITKQNINTYWPEYRLEMLKHNDSPARFSDFVRLHVLSRHGGIWMDASMLCTRSLNWLHVQQKQTRVEVIAYYMHGFTTRPEFPVVESWFIACVPGSKLLELWKKEFMRINDYDTVQEYVDSVQAAGVDLQMLLSPTYLTIHVAAQVVLQKQVAPEDIQKVLLVLKAEDGPFKYLVSQGWDIKKAIESLCTSPRAAAAAPLIKLRSTERSYLAERGSDCFISKP